MTKPPRILIVEDNRLSQVGLTALSKRIPGLGPTALAESVAEARRHFEGPDPPEVVVLDLMLPGEPGEDLIRWLRATHRTPRVVVTTGIHDPAREARVRALGPDAYLAKPYDRDQLLSAIRGEAPGQPKGNP